MKSKTIKKFYLGKPDVIEGRDAFAGAFSNWGRETLAEAIQHAEDRARATGQPQYIVKVVKVVTVKPAPVQIRDVR